MSAKYIEMHKIVDRTTLKILPKEPYSVEYIAQRMYDCYAQVKKVKKQKVIKDVEHGIIAEIIDEKVDPGQWHKINPVEFVKANFEVEDFYKESITKK